MELRELRRRLYYDLPMFEQIEYGNWLIKRTEIYLVANHNGVAQKFRVHPSYRRACDAILEHITEGAANPAPARSVKGRRGVSTRSQYRGVSYNARSSIHPWFAQIYIGNNRMKFAGHYATEEEAAHAYDDYVLTHGLNKPLNFPNDQRQTA
jgi:hypothetical protein